MFVFVSHNRPERCQTALDSMLAAGLSPEYPGRLLVNGVRHAEYSSIRLPPNWDLVLLHDNFGLCQALNLALRLWPNEPWYCTPTDDDLVETHGFDRKLVSAAGPWAVACANDRWQSHVRLWSYCTYGGDLLRAVGQWAPAGLWHWYFDDVWELITAELGLRRWCQDVLTSHVHHYAGTAPDDATYQLGRSRAGEDQACWEAWKRDQWPVWRRRILSACPGISRARSLPNPM